jgi:NADH:ubiquinone oxidoreductase subunit 6 (subunit J)
MIAASMISFLFGAVMGQRFNVVVLVPAVAVMLVLSVGAGFAHPQAAWWITRTAAAGAICLQCGYFAGIAIRHFLAAEPSGESSPLARAETSTRHAAP